MLIFKFLKNNLTILFHSSHNMARYLASGLAMNHMVTTDFAFAENFEKKLAENLEKTLEKIRQQPNDMKTSELCQQSAKKLVDDNVELFVCFVQKRSAEKAIFLIDQRLASEITFRKRARTDGNLDSQGQRFVQLQKQVNLKATPF